MGVESRSYANAPSFPLRSALCQETAGDQSQVTRKQLNHHLDILRVGLIGSAKIECVVHSGLRQKNGRINLETIEKIDAAASHSDKILQTLGALKRAGVLPILRAKDADTGEDGRQ